MEGQERRVDRGQPPFEIAVRLARKAAKVSMPFMPCQCFADALRFFGSDDTLASGTGSHRE